MSSENCMVNPHRNAVARFRNEYIRPATSNPSKSSGRRGEKIVVVAPADDETQVSEDQRRKRNHLEARSQGIVIRKKKKKKLKLDWLLEPKWQ